MSKEKITKEELELKKLELEIKQLNQPWYHKPAYLGFLIAAISLFIAFFTGLIDAKKAKLDLDKARLVRDIEVFEKRRDSLVVQLDFLKTELKTTQKRNLVLEKKFFNYMSNETLNGYDAFSQSDIEVNTADSVYLVRIKLNQTFAIGKYDATQMDYKSVGEAFSKIFNEFKELSPKNYKMNVRVLGIADNINIAPNGIQYHGEFGKLEGKYQYVNNQSMEKFLLKKGDRIYDNKTLGLLRAFTLSKALKDSKLVDDQNISLSAEVSKNLGAPDRNIIIEMEFKEEK